MVGTYTYSQSYINPINLLQTTFHILINKNLPLNSLETTFQELMNKDPPLNPQEDPLETP